jgi:TonB-linked SusC/RagA family outer membrane protein
MALFYKDVQIWRRLCCLIVLLLAVSFSVHAQSTTTLSAGTQTTTVKGKITDVTDGSPVVGANILIKSTTRGTISDVDGNFTLETSPSDILVITFIGFQIQEIPVGSRTDINVALTPSAGSLDEVVVVGYGEQKRVNLSGAIDAVDSKVMDSRPVQNIAQGLQGAIAGLNIDFLSGEPGGSSNINIRGITSINGGGPLILVDGVPMDPSELSFLAPSDVKSITVVKDASAAAIYGARGAYGVVLVTTKSGMKDGVSVNYTNNFSWGKPTVLPNKITDPYIYMRMLETSTDNTPWDYVNYTPAQYEYARQRSDDPSSIGPVRLDPDDNTLYEYMGNRDWTKYFLDNYTTSQRHSLSLSGRSGSTTYYLSGAYDLQNGALNIAEDKFDRYAFRSKVNFQPFKWLTFGNNTMLSITDRARPFHLSIPALYDLFPTSWDKNPDGTWANTDVGRVAASLTQGGKTDYKTMMIQSTFNTEVSLIGKLLRWNSDFTVRRENANNNSYQTKYNIGFGPSDVRPEGNNVAYRIGEFNNYYVFNNYATFEKTLGRHSLTAIAGFNQEYSRSEVFSAQRAGVISSSLPTIGLATGEAAVGEYIEDWAIRGVFYRLNYIFNDKYIFELNGRYDGSSKFPKNKRFGFFPSASAAWRVDQENFWEPVRDVVNTFKIRGSYGWLGNQSVGPYGYISTMNSRRAQYLVGDELPQMVSSPPLVSSNYTWEKVNTRNLGVDLGFLESRVTATFDMYTRDTKDMLTLGKDLPDVLGAVEPNENAADLQTKGWELSLRYDNEFTVANDRLRLNASVVLSDNRTHITKFDNPNGSLTQYYEGKDVGEIWGLRNDGFFQNQSEIEALDESQIVPWGALSIVPGWPRYVDQDGNGAIEKGTTIKDPKDLSVIGNLTPRYRYGVNVEASWKGFDARVFVQGVGKMDYYPLHYLYWGSYQQPYAGGYVHLMDYYRAADDPEALRAQHSQSYINAGLADANTDAQYPVFQAWLADRNLGERVDNAQGLAIPQTKYMLSGAYLRIKNITLGYSFPHTLLERVHISKLRVYVSGENLWEKSEVKKYFDPEAITDNIAKTDPAYNSSNGWGYAYPFQRRYSFGIELQF